MTDREQFLDKLKQQFPLIHDSLILRAAAITWHEITHRLIGRSWPRRERSILRDSMKSAEGHLGTDSTAELDRWHIEQGLHDYEPTSQGPGKV